MDPNQPRITGYLNEKVTKPTPSTAPPVPATPTSAPPVPKPSVIVRGVPVLDLKAFLSQKKLERETRQEQKRRASASSFPARTSVGNVSGNARESNQLWENKLPDKG